LRGGRGHLLALPAVRDRLRGGHALGEGPRGPRRAGGLGARALLVRRLWCAARCSVGLGRGFYERDLVVLLDRDDVVLGAHARVERWVGLLERGRLLGWWRRRGRRGRLVSMLVCCGL